MSERTGIHEATGSGLKLCEEITAVMNAIRARLDDGEYGHLSELLEIQSVLADRADHLAADIAAGMESGSVTDKDRLMIRQLGNEVAQALEATAAAVEYVTAEKEHAAMKLRTIHDGKRAIQSYARMSGH